MAQDLWNLKNIAGKAGLPHFADSKKTILIIDEIQQSAFVYNAIRTIEENISCDLIVTGSYLGRFLAQYKEREGRSLSNT